MKEFYNTNVLYLDTDVLIRAPGIEQIFRLGENCSYEVVGSTDRVLQKDRRLQFLLANIDLGEHKEDFHKNIFKPFRKHTNAYINSGTILFCVNNIHQNGLDWYIQRLKLGLSILMKMRRSMHVYPDQDLINLILFTCSCIDDVASSSRDVYYKGLIQHFAGSRKRFMKTIAKELGYPY